MSLSSSRSRAIFEQAIEIGSPAERESFVREACGQDVELLRAIRRLLDADAEAGGFLPADPGRESPTSVSELELQGATIGRYRLLERIGEGGMGVVYRAQQEEPVRRQVALKIIKLGMDTRQVVARFEAERQALALMDHPNIAKVFDGGVVGARGEGLETRGEKMGTFPAPNPSPLASASGRPYFVMELVDGIPITDFCRQHACSTEARLKLFIQMCGAVQHAHQKGIIHRDLKPSNVLVAIHDGEPLPKVIDFGVAKATNQKLTDKTLLTQNLAMIGTPAYMSPEQADLSGLDVDTRSDIYSLGVLLYELLAGTPPFPEERLRRVSQSEMQRIIAQEEPERPSTRLRKELASASMGLGSAPASGAAVGTMELRSRRTASRSAPSTAFGAHASCPRGVAQGVGGHSTSEGLHPRCGVAGEAPATTPGAGVPAKPRFALAPRPSPLASDLDWIVMKCLEKDRNRRYETANGLAADLKRFLGNEPVVARPPTAAYRVQKLVRRNKLTFIAGAVSTSALLLGIVLSTAQAIRATRAEQEQTRLRGLESQLRAEAQAQALAARRVAYASDMNLAHQALAINNFGRAQELLNRQVPQSSQADLRGWEWRYLWRLCQSDALFRLSQKTDAIGSLAVSRDGKWLAVGESSKGGLSLWDLATRAEIASLATGNGEVRVAFSPREPLVAYTFSSEGKPGNGIRLWNCATKQIVATLPLDDRGAGLAFSEDGRTLVVSTADSDNKITLWQVPDATLLATYPATQRGGHGIAGTPFAVAWDMSVAAHPDIGSDHAKVHVMDLTTGRERWSRVAAEEGITALAFSPDAKILASGAGWVESDIRLWDAASGTEVTRLVGHRGWISELVFWPDGKTLASASADQTIRLWDLSDMTHPRLIRVLQGQKSEVWRLALLPDNSTLVSGSKDGSVYLWNVRKASRTTGPLTQPGRFAAWRFAPDSQSVVTMDQNGRAVEWSGADFQQGTTLMETGHPISPFRARISADGEFAAVAASNRLVHVWDLRRGRLLREIPTSADQVYPITFLAGGKSLVIRNRDDGSLEEWDLSSGKKMRSWQGAFYNEWDVGLAFSPDERRCLTLDFDSGEGRLHDRNTGHDVSLDLNVRQPYYAAFSPDGKLFAASSALGFVKIFETATFQTVATLSGFMLGVRSAVFTPDGTRLATTSDGIEAIKLWDVESHQEVLTLEGQGSEFAPTAFSPDGNILGTMSDGSGVLHLWRASSWAEIEAEEKASPKPFERTTP